MPQIITKYLFSKLLASPSLRHCMERLHAISGMDVLLLDDLGSVRLTVPRHPSVAFVQLLRRYPETEIRFREMRQAGLAGKATVGLGLHEMVYTIITEGETSGYMVLSGYRNGSFDDKDLTATRTLWRRLARAGLSVRWASWHSAWSALPALTSTQKIAWSETVALSMRQVLQRMEGVVPDVEVPAWPIPVQETCRRIREAYDTPLRLYEIAAGFGVCPEHLSRTFHQATGMRFSEYLAETRIAAACEALATSPTPISQIAYQCGFSTLSRFNRCFRQHRGTTPRSWRKRAQRQSQTIL